MRTTTGGASTWFGRANVANEPRAVSAQWRVGSICMLAGHLIQVIVFEKHPVHLRIQGLHRRMTGREVLTIPHYLTAQRSYSASVIRNRRSFEPVVEAQ